MKELENLINALNIENNYHNKIFEEDTFEKLYTKINLDDYNKIKNRIYWLSLLIYRIAFINYLKNINNDIKFSKHNIRKENLIIFHPVINITSEFCKQFKNNFIYPSLISTLARQIIEQICFIKELEKEKIEEKILIEASIESYNKQIGANSLNIEYLNSKNKGLLKVFKNNITYGKLANKYNYGFMYNFFSGDIHIVSQIEKLLPFSTKNNNKFYDIYLNCLLTLLRDYLVLINNYNTEVQVDLKELEKIDFIDIKSNKK
jgi:hypothetical protein